MPIVAEAPYGKFEFPDNTSPDVINRVVKEHAPKPVDKPFVNDAGQLVSSVTGKVVQQPDEGYTGSILPLHLDSQGHLSVAVPASVSAPFKGAVEAGQALAGRGAEPGQPLSPNVIAAEAPFASPLRFGVGLSSSETPLFAKPPGDEPLLTRNRVGEVQAKIHNKAAGQLSKVFEGGQPAGGPNAADVIERIASARKEGQPLTLADIRENPDLRRMIGTIYRQGGEPAARLKQFFESRNIEASARVKKLINEQLADGDIRDTTKQLLEARSNNARPLWQVAENAGPVNSDYLQRLLTNPRVKAGIKRGLEIYRDKADAQNVPFEPSDYAVTGFNEAGDPIIGPVPNMKLWMVAKEGLDSVANSAGMRDPLTGKPTKEGLAVIELRNGLMNELDSRVPSYKAARDAWSGDTASIRAVEEGRHAFDNKWFTPEELAEHFNSLSASDKQFFFLGIADELKARLSRTVDAADKAKAIINNEDARARIRALKSDPEQAERFINAIERERVMKETSTETMHGSPTAERENADRRALEQMKSGAGQAALSLVRGHPIEAYRGAVRAAEGVLARRRAAEQLKINEELARLLTNPDIGLSGVQGTPLVPPGINYQWPGGIP